MFEIEYEVVLTFRAELGEVCNVWVDVKAGAFGVMCWAAACTALGSLTFTLD